MPAAVRKTRAELVGQENQVSARAKAELADLKADNQKMKETLGEVEKTANMYKTKSEAAAQELATAKAQIEASDAAKAELVALKADNQRMEETLREAETKASMYKTMS